MRELADLLRKNHNVRISKNLRPKVNSSDIASNGPKSHNRNNLRDRLVWLKEIPYLSLVVSLFNLISFNLKAAYVSIFHAETLVIITQPFLLWPLSTKSNFVYIRRASVPLSETIGIDPVKRLFEYGFRGFPSCRTVYLTDFPEREKDSWVIPNFLDISKPGPSLKDDKRKNPEIFVTGTFSYRKGADRVIELSSRMSENIPINVIGAVADEFVDAEKGIG